MRLLNFDELDAVSGGADEPELNPTADRYQPLYLSLNGEIMGARVDFSSIDATGHFLFAGEPNHATSQLLSGLAVTAAIGVAVLSIPVIAAFSPEIALAAAVYRAVGAVSGASAFFVYQAEK